MVTMPGVGNFSSGAPAPSDKVPEDRKSTRLNSSHLVISYAVFCLKKKKINHITLPARLRSLLGPSGICPDLHDAATPASAYHLHHTAHRDSVHQRIAGLHHLHTLA